MTRWIGGVVALGVIVWAYRTFGFIRIERPLVEQKRDLFTSTVPRYHRTQPGKPKATVTAIESRRRKAS